MPGGWSLKSIFNAHTGPPFSVFNSTTNLPLPDATARASFSGPVPTTGNGLIATGLPGAYQYITFNPNSDFDEFEHLTMRLSAIGWTAAPKLEHRWIAPHRTIIDLLPAGAKLHRSGSITWPAPSAALGVLTVARAGL